LALDEAHCLVSRASSGNRGPVLFHWRAQRIGAPPVEQVELTPPLQCVRKRELAKMLSVDPWTIDHWRRKGIIPEPIVLSDQVLVWRLADIEKWLREKEAAKAPWSRRKKKKEKAVGA
jgi:predicted DNA-binding transcriptional regulator AlpA